MGGAAGCKQATAEQSVGAWRCTHQDPRHSALCPYPLPLQDCMEEDLDWYCIDIDPSSLLTFTVRVWVLLVHTAARATCSWAAACAHARMRGKPLQSWRRGRVRERERAPGNWSDSRRLERCERTPGGGCGERLPQWGGVYRAEGAL